MHDTVELFTRSMKRVQEVSKNPKFPYALSEIRAFYLCNADLKRMTTYEGAKELARLIEHEAGLTVVKWDPVFIGAPDAGHGYTLTTTLTESGVAHDCWPEYGTVLQYLDLCNVEKDNSYKAELLWKHVAHYFGAEWMYVVPPVLIPINPAHIDQSKLIAVA